MIKSSFISIIPQEDKKENKGSIEFQIASSLIRYEDLHHNHCSSLYDITKAQLNS